MGWGVQGKNRQLFSVFQADTASQLSCSVITHTQILTTASSPLLRHEKVNPKKGPEATSSSRRRTVAADIVENSHRLCEENNLTVLARL